VFGDGLVELKKHLSVKEVARLIAETARWVDPETFRLLPVWYPEYARGKHLHNDNWNEIRRIEKKDTGEVQDKKEGNTQANIALCKAMGTTSKVRPNWTCCHIWGVDDPTFARRNTVVKDHRFFTCVANMVLLPTPLKAFTDVVPEIKAMLRSCSATLYGWKCDHPDLAHAKPAVFDPADFPDVWLQPQDVPGIVPINDKIRTAAIERKARIKRELQSAGPHYPREEVRAALRYWNIAL
jgi:hypothetical protein